VSYIGKKFTHRQHQAWLPSLLRRIRAAKSLPNNGRLIPYFLPLYCDIHDCTGGKSTDGRHLEISPSLNPLFTIQLGKGDHEKCKGRLAEWFKSFLSPRASRGVECWRRTDGEGVLCSGTRTDYRQFIVSLPVIFVVEFVQDDLPKPWEWYIPPKLNPPPPTLNKAHDVVYDLVGLSVITDNLSGNHFSARFYNPNEKAVYVYDDMKHSGRAQRMPDGVLTKQVAGYPVILPLRQAVHHAVYYLRGGLSAQQVFYKTRLATLTKNFQISVQHQSPSNFSFLSYGRKLTLLPSHCRYWIKAPKNQTLFNEYAHATQEAVLQVEATATPPPAESEETLHPGDITQTERARPPTMEDLYARVHTPDDDDDDLPSNPCYTPPPPTPPKITREPLPPPFDTSPPEEPSEDNNLRLQQLEKLSDEINALIEADLKEEEEMAQGSNPGPVRLRCRCGLAGDPREILAIAPGEGELQQCTECKNLSHRACEPDGQALARNWRCHRCSGPERKAPTMDVTSRW
jgi:hypothetical protein